MIKRFCIYAISFLLILTSCDKEVVVPVAGMWANVNYDGSVARLIEFKDGAFTEYIPDADMTFYYHDEIVWHATYDDFHKNRFPYYIESGNLIVKTSEMVAPISVDKGKLILNSVEYQSVKGLDSNYGSDIILNVPITDDNCVEYSQSSQDLIWEYEISNIVQNSNVYVKANVNWIKNISVDHTQIKFHLDENPTSDRRVAVVALSHPAAGIKEINLLQLCTIYSALVETLAPENVSYTQATLKGAVLDDGNGKIKSKGFYFGINPENLDKYLVESDDTVTFFLTLNNLQDDLTYYYKAFAENENGESCGKICTFDTYKINKPSVQTGDASEILPFSAKVSGSIINNGGADIQECGFYYGTDTAPSVGGIKKTVSVASDIFSSVLEDLTDDTIYYFQAYARNQKGESFGDVVSFKSLPIYTPSVKTNSATNITYTSAELNGTIISDGGTEIIDCGFYYGNSQSEMMRVSCGAQPGKFSADVTGLDDGTTYYFKAYAVNSVGECAGETMAFTTTEISIPDVSTVSSEDVSYTTAKVSGTVNSDGGTSVTEYGFYYWNTLGKENKVVVGDSSLGAFSVVLTGLDNNTTYHFRAYATNSKGTAYGTTLSFTTRYDPFNGYEYVDLGLPSGTKWATMNIGASSPYEAGSTFQWGCISTGDQGNPMREYTDCISGTEYDAATALWKGDWQIPTYTQACELFEYCTYQVIRENGTTCYLYTSNINNKTIILPAASHWTGNSGTYFSISYERAYYFYGYGFLSESQAEKYKGSLLCIRPVSVP